MLLDKNFDIDAVDANEKVFKSVSTIDSSCRDSNLELKLDYNSDLFKVEKGDKINFALSTTLKKDSSDPDEKWEFHGEPSLMDDFEYVMSGTIFQISMGEENEFQVYASFGGLIMRLKGGHSHLTALEADMKIFALIKRI